MEYWNIGNRKRMAVRFNKLIRTTFKKIDPSPLKSAFSPRRRLNILYKPEATFPVFQHSNTPALQYSTALQHAITPALQHYSTPSLQYSSTPALQHSNTPALQHSEI